VNKLELNMEYMSLNDIINNNDFVIISKDNCNNCKILDLNLKQFNIHNLKYFNINHMLSAYDEHCTEMSDILLQDIELLKTKCNINTYPMIFIKHEYIQYDTVINLITFDNFIKYLDDASILYDINEKDDF